MYKDSFFRSILSTLLSLFCRVPDGLTLGSHTTDDVLLLQKIFSLRQVVVRRLSEFTDSFLHAS